MAHRFATKLFLVVIGTVVLGFGSVFVLHWRRSSPESVFKTNGSIDIVRIQHQPRQVLFFNRVPKTGSEMMALLLQWLQGRNDFELIRLGGNDQRQLTEQQSDDLAEEIASKIHQSPPGSKIALDRHVYFTDLENTSKLPSGAAHMVYISIVRDPIEKASSRFYYKRATKRNSSSKNSLQVDQRRGAGSFEGSFEDCVKNSHPECTFITGEKYDLTIPYFCGHQQECMVLNSKWALDKAMENVQQHYSVVGVLEELNKTLSSLEKNIPDFFRGVQDLFFQELEQPKWNWNKDRPRKISQDVMKLLRRNLTMEYQFYNFVKQKLQENGFN